MNNKKCLGKNNNLNKNNNLYNNKSKKNNMLKGTNKKELGCTNPITGVKSKCIIRIVPKNSRECTFKMDPKCKARRQKKTKKSKKY